MSGKKAGTMSESTPQSTILIVDDSPVNIKALGEPLKALYKIRIATNGEKALEIAKASNPPDLILLDIVMPTQNGYEVCKKLKADSTTKNIPVIFITALDEEKDETKGLELGAVDYITKPFSLPIVIARLKTHLELKHHRDILENLSSIDGLTGLPNRRRQDEMLQLEWKRAVRESIPISLVMVDIDHFKLYNDNLGHLAGDDCLKQVAKTLTASTHRPTDFASRFGGEEFLLILPDTDLEGALYIAETFRKNLEDAKVPHNFSPISDLVTCSMGVATIIPTTQDNPQSLIQAADQTLYQSKDQGRNCIRTIDLGSSVPK